MIASTFDSKKFTILFWIDKKKSWAGHGRTNQAGFTGPDHSRITTFTCTNVTPSVYLGPNFISWWVFFSLMFL